MIQGNVGLWKANLSYCLSLHLILLEYIPIVFNKIKILLLHPIACNESCNQGHSVHSPANIQMIACDVMYNVICHMWCRYIWFHCISDIEFFLCSSPQVGDIMVDTFHLHFKLHTKKVGAMRLELPSLMHVCTVHTKVALEARNKPTKKTPDFTSLPRTRKCHIVSTLMTGRHSSVPCKISLSNVLWCPTGQLGRFAISSVKYESQLDWGKLQLPASPVVSHTS
jgi:hypothetical protein